MKVSDIKPGFVFRYVGGFAPAELLKLEPRWINGQAINAVNTASWLPVSIPPDDEAEVIGHIRSVVLRGIVGDRQLWKAAERYDSRDNLEIGQDVCSTLIEVLTDSPNVV